MQAQAWVQAAAGLSAPLFVLIVGLLVLFSIAGFPIPITVTLLLAGALTTRMSHGGVIFLLLVVVVALVATLRDTLALLLGRGGGHLWRRNNTRAVVAGQSTAGAGPVVRQPISVVPRRSVWHTIWQRIGPHLGQNSVVVRAAQGLSPRQRAVMLVLTRLSPLASPFDIAFGILGLQLRIFVPPILLGRALYAIVLLGAGALSGAAWQRGASVPGLIGIFSLIVLVLLVLPAILSRRVLARSVT